MGDELNVLSAFVAVAEERSFTRAAKRLNISTSGLSHAIRHLEEQIGVRLLARTTRSVSPTEAGEQLLLRLRPALGDIRETLEQLAGLQSRAVGRVKLVVPRLAAKSVVAPKLGQFARDYPDVVLDVTTDDSHLDLVAAGFDAGIQFGEYIAQDMIAVRVSPDHRPAIVGSPAYFESRAKPQSPSDLLQHRCINFRHGAEGIYRWELDKADQSLAVAVNGPLVGARLLRERDIRAGRTHGVAQPPARADSDRDGGLRLDAMRRRAGGGDTRRRRRLVSAGSPALARRHSDDRHDTHRDSGSA